MINLLYEPLPDTITADGIKYTLLTDYREWLRFADLIRDKRIDDTKRISQLALWLDPIPKLITADIVSALFHFYKAAAIDPDLPEAEDNDAEPEDDAAKPEDDAEPEDDAAKPPVFDWCIDAKYIIGDFLRYYGIDLLSVEYLHWWHFKALFAALPDDSVCQKRIAYRSVDLGTIKDDKERARIARIQRSIAIPYECEDDMIAAAFGNFL